MASAVTLTKLSPPLSSIDQSTIDYYFTAAVAAGTYTTGGLPFSFGGLVHAPGAPLAVRSFSFTSPLSGFNYAYNPGSPATQTSGKLVISQAGSEIAAGATPAGVVADVIRMIATFVRG